MWGLVAKKAARGRCVAPVRFSWAECSAVPHEALCRCMAIYCGLAALRKIWRCHGKAVTLPCDLALLMKSIIL